MLESEQVVKNKKKPAKVKNKPVSKPKLLSGGNPQVAKADGDAPVQAYIDAMPDWRQEIGRRLDKVITKTIPSVRKAIRWNSPFYGIEGKGWFVCFHTYTNYVKVTFFKGTLLRPIPPGESKDKQVRYLDIRKDDKTTDEQLASWIQQAAALPGWIP